MLRLPRPTLKSRNKQSPLWPKDRRSRHNHKLKNWNHSAPVLWTNSERNNKSLRTFPLTPYLHPPKP